MPLSADQIGSVGATPAHLLAHAVKAKFDLNRAINPKWSGATYREQYLNRTFKVGYIKMSHALGHVTCESLLIASWFD